MLETRRLYLIPFGPEDLSLLHRLFTHPFVREHLWDGVEIDLEESKKFIDANQKYFLHYKWGLWKVLYKEHLSEVGFVGLWPLFEDPWPQLLYGLFPQFSGHGYATEASQAVVDYAFDKLEFPYLKASIDTDHKSSQNLAKRLKMTPMPTQVIEERPTIVYCINAPVPHPISNLN